MMAIPSGREGGRVMAKRRPVIIAEPSRREWSGIFLSQRTRASVAREAATHDKSKITALSLKK
jgi:hypothetical protein